MSTIKGYSDQLVTMVKNSGTFEHYPDWSRPMARQLAREACRRLELDEISLAYAVTIHKWYENWKRNEEAIVAKYGQRWFRMWMMFLAWSVIIGAQGSSTVFMVTLAKNTKNDKDSVSSEEADAVPYSRAARWIGKKPVATQQ